MLPSANVSEIEGCWRGVRHQERSLFVEYNFQMETDPCSCISNGESSYCYANELGTEDTPHSRGRVWSLLARRDEKMCVLSCSFTKCTCLTSLFMFMGFPLQGRNGPDLNLSLSISLHKTSCSVPSVWIQVELFDGRNHETRTQCLMNMTKLHLNAIFENYL